MWKREADAGGESEIAAGRFLLCLRAFAAFVLLESCAPARVYHSPVPRPAPPPLSSSTQTPRNSRTESGPVLESGKIKEEDMKEKRAPLAQPAPKGQIQQAPAAREEPRPLPDDSSLIAKINPRTSPQRAASLRLTEEGRKLLESGEYAKALGRLEKTIAIDSTNPYGYFYLAKAHYRLGHYKESLNFLDVAESLVTGQPYWLAEVFALKGDDYRALGLLQQADSSYSQALRVNPGNRVAIDGLNSLRGETQPSPH